MRPPVDDDSDEFEVIMGVRIRKPKKPKDGEPPKPAPPPKEDQRTSYGRFYTRVERFKKTHRLFPRTRHVWWWLIHNVIAHLAIAFLPIKPSFRFHDWTSDRLNLRGAP